MTMSYGDENTSLESQFTFQASTIIIGTPCTIQYNIYFLPLSLFPDNTEFK